MRTPLELLDFNSSKEFIVPSAGQYPHLWLWDACFHAIILAYLRPELAYRELEALFRSQQSDGLIPHVTFNTEVDPNRYRPNPDDWATGGPHSGITQTPLVAPALKIVYQKTGNRRFLVKAFDFFKAQGFGFLQRKPDFLQGVHGYPGGLEECRAGNGTDTATFLWSGHLIL